MSSRTTPAPNVAPRIPSAPDQADGALLQSMFEQSPFSTVIYDAAGRPMAVNQPFREMWGVGLDTAPLGYSVLADPELERHGVLPYIRRAFDGETVVMPPVRYDIAMVSTGQVGRSIWTEAYLFPVRDAAGRLSHVVLHHLDVTARMEVDAERERTQARARDLLSLATALSEAATLERVADAMFREGLKVVGADAGSLALVVEVNGDPRSLRITRSAGYGSELEEKTRSMPVTPGRPLSDAILSRRPVLLATGDEWDARYPNAPRAEIAALGYEAFAALPVVIADRAVAGISFSFRGQREFDDDTQTLLATIGQICAQALDRARSFDAERTARSDAEGANRAKMEFLATMSHELRTPLNAIGGYAELLQMGVRGAVTDAQRTDLDRILRSQQHLMSLINDVLNFAKIEAGKVDVVVMPVNVQQTLAILVPLVAPQLAAKHLTLDATSCGEGVRALADDDKLKQVLLNLLSNAVKFTIDGGRILVTCEETAAGVRIAIHDTGIGIAPEYLERIFDPFVQLERRLTNIVSGTGLGLAISRDLARAMGGEVTVESKLGVGSIFTVHLRGVQ